TVLPPGTILDMHYEDLVADTEGQARRLFDHLGLPWDSRCLAFHENKRHVRTASAAQVRKPIYKSSIARWEHYAKHLTPLIAVLNVPLAPQGSPSPTSVSHRQAREYHITGRLQEAQAAYRQIVQTAPYDGQALHQLGLIAHAMGDDSAAIELLQQAIEIIPADSNLQNDLGGLFNIQGKLEPAVAHFRGAIALAPLNAQAHYNLGCTLQAQGKLAEAETCYREALKIKPNSVDILCNLGSSLQEQGKADEAISCYRQALASNPGDINSLNNLGVSLQTNGKLEEAKACFEQTIAVRPDDIRAYINLGMVYYDHGNFSQALSCYQQALRIDPHYSEALFSIGVALQALCKPQEALAYYRQAAAIKDTNQKTQDNLLMTLQFIPGVTLEELYAAHARFGQQFEKTLKPHWPLHSNNRDPDRRLKIGYVSGDFRMHAVSYFIEPVFASHDKSQFEVFCYSNSLSRDAFTERLIAEADHWQPCLSMSDDQLAERIQDDQIDILIDLAGHTAHNRLLTFARKPAPIQITYLGYPGSSGLAAMDYRLTDHYAEPGNDRYYTEKLLRLPDSMWCYRPAADMPDITPLPAQKNGYLTFGSFNNINKVGEDCIQLWAALLRSLPSSRLLMVTVPEGEVRDRLTRQFEALGIHAKRLSFCGKLPSHEFRKMLQQVDITLDPFPINGATTTCESLWLGMPVLTLVGERFLSRAGLSVLSAAQLPDFAVATPAEYINTATLLANNLALLADIRLGLRDHLKTSPLLNHKGFTQNLESIYRKIWVNWCGDTK
ncbi:MAG TPA: tetratricopeptide repeat protein, partial [Burkholderiaceae bacterium]|nr:tetratricopeptide repeat protein [Burkholderiaceae bacterium]